MTEPRFFLSIVIILIAGIFDFAVTFLPHQIDIQLLTVILTALNGNGVAVIVQYWLGSSKSSNDKYAVIAQKAN